MKHYHVHIDVRDALSSWTEREFENAISREGRILSPLEARTWLMIELARGIACVPMDNCDNFCAQHGCRGHDSSVTA